MGERFFIFSLIDSRDLVFCCKRAESMFNLQSVLDVEDFNAFVLRVKRKCGIFFFGEVSRNE